MWSPIFIGGAAFAAWTVLVWMTCASVTSKYWRGEIASASAAVQAAAKQAGEEALLTDAQIIAALGDTDAKLKQAQDAIKLAKARTPADGCVPIPAHCLRQ